MPGCPLDSWFVGVAVCAALVIGGSFCCEEAVADDVAAFVHVLEVCLYMIANSWRVHGFCCCCCNGCVGVVCLVLVLVEQGVELVENEQAC